MPQQKLVLVQNILDTLRKEQYDIRQFNFSQLVAFIEHVADVKPQDLHIFTRYVDIAIAHYFFDEKEIEEKPQSLLMLIHALALHDQLKEGAAYFKFMLSITEALAH